jgi:signal transduction histidine kinase/DNA-binding NarL/FixJ family response regulator
MTSKRTIYYLLAAFIAGNLLLVYLQYNSSKNIDGLISGNERLLNEFRVDKELGSLEKSIHTIEKDVRNTVVSGNMAYAVNIDRQVAVVEQSLQRLQEINDDDSAVEFIDELDHLVREKVAISRKILDTFRLSGKTAAEQLFVTQQQLRLTENIDNVATKVDSSRRHVLAVLTDQADKNGRKARSWGIVLIALVLISGAGMFWFIINRMARQNELIVQLDASEKKVREAAKVKENFMANMSHEIRTPLNAILGFTRLLQKEPGSQATKEHVQAIQSSGESLLTIINDILDLSKIEAGMMRIEPVPFNVRDLLHSVTTLFLQKTNEKNLQLLTEVSPEVPATIIGDPTRLTQILVNLIGNAIKFTHQGHIKVLIVQEAIQDHQVVIGITISDTGIGIEPGKLQAIFERFRQAEDTVTRQYGGTGLGLSIVKELVELQQGHIRVDSEPGKGTSFQLSIPYQPATAFTTLAAQQQGNPVSYPALTGIRVLVAEDNPINQQLMKHLLKGWQVQFDIANNGEEAIALLQHHRYDLILMDIQMPVMDGYTATEKIRHTLQLDTPIIAMTAHAIAGEKEKCLSSGMNDYLSKPLHEQALYKIMAQLAGKPTLTTIEKNVPATPAASHYQYISLEYMKSISSGDADYERTVTEQFLEIIPEDLQAMETAYKNDNLPLLQQLAHNMKTSVSVMGLTVTLQPHLDAIEQEQINTSSVREHLTAVQAICTPALQEARHFYTSLTDSEAI